MSPTELQTPEETLERWCRAECSCDPSVGHLCELCHDIQVLRDLIIERDLLRYGVEKDSMTNERKNITQPPDWWAAFETAAKAEGMTLAEWLGEAAKAKLPKATAKKLSKRPPANRPKKDQ